VVSLKVPTFKSISLILRRSLVAFALLGCNEYIDMILLQLALWEYQAQFKHPVIDVLNRSVTSFVGEDIELFNRLLSQHSQPTRDEVNLSFLTLPTLLSQRWSITG